MITKFVYGEGKLGLAFCKVQFCGVTCIRVGANWMSSVIVSVNHVIKQYKLA